MPSDLNNLQMLGRENARNRIIFLLIGINRDAIPSQNSLLLREDRALIFAQSNLIKSKLISRFSAIVARGSNQESFKLK